MLGALFGMTASAGSRLIGFALGLSIWLLSRPGGWAVLVVLVLLGMKFARQTGWLAPQ